MVPLTSRATSPSRQKILCPLDRSQKEIRIFEKNIEIGVTFHGTYSHSPRRDIVIWEVARRTTLRRNRPQKGDKSHPFGLYVETYQNPT